MKPTGNELKCAISGFALASLIALSFFAFVLLQHPLPQFASGGCYLQKAIFSPDSESEIISLFNSASKTIDVQMYVFSNENLARSLANAARRGVVVRVLLEGRIEGVQQNRDTLDYLTENGAYAKWASFSYKLTHSKLAIADGKYVLVGSINFSNSAVSKNREAAALLSCNENNDYAAMFEQDWQKAGA